MYTHPKTEARNGNFIFVIGEEERITFRVTSTNVSDITLNTTMFPTGKKDIHLPSNKVEIDPLIITFVVSEDFSEWIDIYKWLLRAKNKPENYDGIVDTCKLVCLDKHNNPTITWVYKDCYPITLESIQFMIDNEGNQVITTSSSLRYNQLEVQLSNGEVIKEDYAG